jgi:hypothetical protein
MELDRRSFLKGLIAIAALPAGLSAIPIADLKPTAEVWQKIEESPTVFFVRNGCTLDLEDFIPPATRGEGFDFGEYELKNVEALLDRAREVQPVIWELERQYGKFRRSLIDDEQASRPESKQGTPTEAEKIWPEDADEEIIEKWVHQMSENEVADLNSAMRTWAASEPDWLNEEGEHFTITSSGQEYALEFFDDYAGEDVLDELGIEIVEGDRPGSSYYAAELYIPIEEANEKAIAAGVPVRFKVA